MNDGGGGGMIEMCNINPCALAEVDIFSINFDLTPPC